MFLSYFNNFSYQFWSIIFIVAGTILGALGSYRDNKTITNLLEKNRTWSEAMDKKVEENAKLTGEIKDISNSIEQISTKNNQILDENVQINKDVGEIVKEIKNISDKTGELTENINENSEALKFFNSNNYTYLEKYFPIGYRVIRQNVSGNNFIKTYGNVLEYDYFEISLHKSGNNELRYVIKNNRFLEDNRVVNYANENGKIEGVFDANNYTTLWILIPIELLKGHYLSLLLLDDGYEFTYAVGQVPISQLFPNQ